MTPICTITREEAIEALDAAEWALNRMSCGTQRSDVRWTAKQLEAGRGPVWMLREAREYRRGRILRSRETGGYSGRHPMSSRFSVRASLFVAAVLRACAARGSS